MVDRAEASFLTGTAIHAEDSLAVPLGGSRTRLRAEEACGPAPCGQLSYALSEQRPGLRAVPRSLDVLTRQTRGDACTHSVSLVNCRSARAVAHAHVPHLSQRLGGEWHTLRCVNKLGHARSSPPTEDATAAATGRLGRSMQLDVKF
jgi:hypothetical protein